MTRPAPVLRVDASSPGAGSVDSADDGGASCGRWLTPNLSAVGRRRPATTSRYALSLRWTGSTPCRALWLHAGRAIPASTIGSVAYDEALAERMRELLAGEADVTEMKMFGGLAFLIGGNMAVAASGQGGVLARVDPAESEKLVATTNARPMEMRGRAMQGWLRVDPDDVRTKRQLARWVKLGATYARSLPEKR